MRRLASSLAIVLCILTAFIARAETLDTPPFRIHYPPGQESLARMTSGILLEADREFTRRLPLGDGVVTVHLFDDPAAFQQFAGDIPTRRIEGFALSRQGVIALKAPELLGPEADYTGVVRHELLHVLIDRNLGPENVPRWFNEGLAMLLSRENRIRNNWTTAQLAFNGGLVPLNELNDSFAAPGDEWEFGAAYEQSLSLTRYLRDHMGTEAFWLLIHDLQVTPLDSALEGRGIDLNTLESNWRGHIRRQAAFAAIVSGFTIFQLAAVLCLLAYWRRVVRKRRIMQAWDEEDEELAGEVFGDEE